MGEPRVAATGLRLVPLGGRRMSDTDDKPCLCPHAGLSCCDTEGACCTACENECDDREEDTDEWD